MIYELEIDSIPPSVNLAYGYSRFGGYLKGPGKVFKMLVFTKVKCQSFKCLDTKETYSLDIEFHAPWWRTKEGSVRKRDVSNLVKIAEDAFIEAIGIDDSRFWEVHIKKVVSDKEKTIYRLS